MSGGYGYHAREHYGCFICWGPCSAVICTTVAQSKALASQVD